MPKHKCKACEKRRRKGIAKHRQSKNQAKKCHAYEDIAQLFWYVQGRA